MVSDAFLGCDADGFITVLNFRMGKISFPHDIHGVGSSVADPS